MTIPANIRYNKKLSIIWNLSAELLSNDSDDARRVKPKEEARTQIPDEELVSFAKRGDTRAFELLILKYQRQIFNLIYQMTRNVDVVEDIGQDVFVAAFKAIPDFQARSSFFTWIYRIAINHCKNYLTASHRAQDIETRYRVEHTSSEEQSLDYDKNPQSQLLAKEMVQQMEEAMTSLPAEQRLVLTLCEFQALSYQEISEILDCPIGTVRSRLSRARTALQEALEQYM